MDKLTVLLIEDNPDYAALVGHWLSQPNTGIEYVLNWADFVADGCRRLAQGGISVVLLDLNLQDSEGAATFAAVRAQTKDVPVIVLSAGDEVPLALHLIEEGADNYLVKSSCDAESLTRAIRYAVVKQGVNVRRQETKASPDQAKIVAVIGGKGGVGATTVACTLASELRRRCGEAVLLADLDMYSGLVAFLMSVHPKYDILYATSNAVRLDRRMWERIVVKSEDGVEVACSPALAGPSDELSDAFPERLSHVLTAIKPFYRWIVLDVGRLTGYTTKILQPADEFAVVTTPSIPALYETRRAVEALRAAGMAGRIRLTVNRTDSVEECSRKELQDIFGLEVAAMLPFCGPELRDAYWQKRLPARNSSFTKSIENLIRVIGGPKEAESQRRLLSLASRFRRKDNTQAQPALG